MALCRTPWVVPHVYGAMVAPWLITYVCGVFHLHLVLQLVYLRACQTMHHFYVECRVLYPLCLHLLL